MTTAAADLPPVPAESESGSSRGLFGHLETILAILLGLAAMLLAVSSYQGALRGGDSLVTFNEGIRSINDANYFFNEAVQVSTRDQALFLQYAQALQSDQEELAAYLEENIMDDNLRGAVQQWVDDETDEIASPLEAPAYELPQQAEGERLQALTDQQFTEARALDEQGDRYDLVGVIVASSLFFLGIAAVVSRRSTKLVGLGLGTVTLVLSFVLWLMV